MNRPEIAEAIRVLYVNDDIDRSEPWKNLANAIVGTAKSEIRAEMEAKAAPLPRGVAEGPARPQFVAFGERADGKTPWNQQFWGPFPDILAAGIWAGANLKKGYHYGDINPTGEPAPATKCLREFCQCGQIPCITSSDNTCNHPPAPPQGVTVAPGQEWYFVAFDPSTDNPEYVGPFLAPGAAGDYAAPSGRYYVVYQGKSATNPTASPVERKRPWWEHPIHDDKHQSARPPWGTA